jgi:hypothetical protein
MDGRINWIQEANTTEVEVFTWTHLTIAAVARTLSPRAPLFGVIATFVGQSS